MEGNADDDQAYEGGSEEENGDEDQPDEDGANEDGNADEDLAYEGGSEFEVNEGPFHVNTQESVASGIPTITQLLTSIRRKKSERIIKQNLAKRIVTKNREGSTSTAPVNVE